MANGQNPYLKTLQDQLQQAFSHDEAVRQRHQSGQPLHIPHTGKALSAAYEQLRNAAEYAEEHLILQRAIRRFYNRTLFISNRANKDIGEELIIELAQAGYLSGDTFSTETTHIISELVNENLQLFVKLRQHKVPAKIATDWILSVLSVKTENFLNPHAYHDAAINFTYYFFRSNFSKHNFVQNRKEDESYELSLYTAVHQALLKSDIDVIRTALLTQQEVPTDDIHFYIKWNRQIDEIHASGLTQRLRRAVLKNGAPFRILKSMLEDSPQIASQTLPEREQFLQAYQKQINNEYKQTSQRLNNGIVKSIIFILITKSIIGFAIEIPVDLLLYDNIIILPLLISLLFPPLYMASIRLGLKMPSRSNALATKHYIDSLLYSENTPKLIASGRQRMYSPATKFAYSILFFVPLVFSVWILSLLQFNPLQMFIFFMFFSTATFLGFRLRSMVRELKISSGQNGLLPLMVDFFYLPFVLLGQWLSGKYARIDIVGKFLDIVIEMPLKTVLRLIRQWMNFLQEKHDEIY
jgi:hypothetical protein